jgi:uncharacterized protein
MPNLTSDFFYEELDNFLMSDFVNDDCMMLSNLDGFLTGITIGPELIMPSEWLPLIWGDDDPEFESEAQANRIIGLIMARYSEILRCLMEAPEEWVPIFTQSQAGKVIASDWVEGFMAAVSLRINTWKEIMTDEDACFLMAPIMAWMPESENRNLIDGEMDKIEMLRDNAETFIPMAIAGMNTYLEAHRNNVPPTRRAARKVGRNDPCPCGSEKKFKKCCGA